MKLITATAAPALTLIMALASVLIANPTAAQAQELSASANSPPQIVKQKPCGKKEDVHLCGQLNASNLKLKLPTFKISAPKGAQVAISWNGTVFCSGNYSIVGLPRTDALERTYVLNLQVQDYRPSDIELNGEGSTSLGHSDFKNQSEQAINLDRQHFELYPVSLNRIFVKKNSGSENYFVYAAAEFRTGPGICNINGGAMTATVLK